MSEARNIVEQYPMENMVAGTPQTTVYRSTDASSGRPVAVKIISSPGSGTGGVVRQHFLRAMGAVQFLQLPAFPEILDFGFDETDSGFMVMEWVEGMPIGDFKGKGLRRLLPLFLQLSEALEALAMGQVYHLNLCPDNILVETGEGGEQVRILGFGTSIYLTGSRSGAMMGHSPDSDSYMAPERLDPETAPEADGNLADLYSLALIAIELLAAGVELSPDGDRKVLLPRETGAAEAAVEKLESVLTQALRMDPTRRKVSYPLLKKCIHDVLESMEREKTVALSAAQMAELRHEAETNEVENTGGRISRRESTAPYQLDPEAETMELELPPADPSAVEEDFGEKTVAISLSDPVFQADAEAPTQELKKDLGGSVESTAVQPIPPVVEEMAGADLDDTDPALGSEAHRQAAENVAASKLDDTDPGIFDPNETNPAIDPEKILSSPMPPPVEASAGDASEVPAPPPLPVDADISASPLRLQTASAEAINTPPLPPSPIASEEPLPPPVAPENKRDASASEKRSGGVPKIVIILVPILLLLFLGVLVLVGMKACSTRQEVKQIPAELPTPQPTPEPVQPTAEASMEENEEGYLHPILQRAGDFLQTGDLEAAREELAHLKPEEIEAFSDEEKQSWEAISRAAQGSRLDAAVSDLEGGLELGSIRMLKRAVSAFGRMDSSEYSKEVAAKLRKTRKILGLHARLWKAHEAGKEADVLQLSAEMIGLLPKYSTPYKFRDEAAAGLEEASRTAMRQRNYRLAREVLKPVNDYYPERKGLNELLAEIDASEGRLRSQKQVLEQARVAGIAGHPESALKTLGGIDFDVSLADEARELRKSLREQISELDRDPPVVTLLSGQKLSFKKKKTVKFHLEISDDYRVENALVFLSFGAKGKFVRRDLQLDERGHCTITVTPKEHHNEDFHFYVEARDHSGHIGTLGSATKPIEVKRLKGLKAIFGGK